LIAFATDSGDTRSTFLPGICELATDSQSAEQHGGAASEGLPLLSGLQQLSESLCSSKQPQTPAQTWPETARSNSSDVTHFTIRTVRMTALRDVCQDLKPAPYYGIFGADLRVV
jgi:hypothetical protein